MFKCPFSLSAALAVETALWHVSGGCLLQPRRRSRRACPPGDPHAGTALYRPLTPSRPGKGRGDPLLPSRETGRGPRIHERRSSLGRPRRAERCPRTNPPLPGFREDRRRIDAVCPSSNRKTIARLQEAPGTVLSTGYPWGLPPCCDLGVTLLRWPSPVPSRYEGMTEADGSIEQGTCNCPPRSAFFAREMQGRRRRKGGGEAGNGNGKAGKERDGGWVGGGWGGGEARWFVTRRLMLTAPQGAAGAVSPRKPSMPLSLRGRWLPLRIALRRAIPDRVEVKPTGPSGRVRNDGRASHLPSGGSCECR